MVRWMALPLGEQLLVQDMPARCGVIQGSLRLPHPASCFQTRKTLNHVLLSCIKNRNLLETCWGGQQTLRPRNRCRKVLYFATASCF